MLSAIILAAALEFGFTEVDMVEYPDALTYAQFFSQACYTQVDVSIGIGPFLAEGGIKTSVLKKSEGIEWFPLESSYHIGARLSLGAFDFGVRHVCSHPVVPYRQILRPAIHYDGSVTEAYVTIKSGIP